MRKVKFLGYGGSGFSGRGRGEWVVGQEYALITKTERKDDLDFRVEDERGRDMWERRACFEEVSTDD